MITDKKKKNNNFKVENQDKSGLSAFIKRPVPSEDEVEDFEEVLDKEIRHQEIDANLNEIYSDKDGGLVDVKKMKIRKRSFLLVRLFKKALLIVLLLLVAYFVYIYYFAGDNDMSAVNFEITAPEEVVVGENFSYIVSYKNPTKFAISDVRLELTYPENFIFGSSSLEAGNFTNSFNLADISAGEEGSVFINGQIIGQVQSVNVVNANFNYIPVNFSSQFKKQSSSATVVKGIGFEIDLDYPDLIFVGQKSEIDINFSNLEDNHLGDIIIEFILPPSAEIELKTKEENVADNLIESEGPSAWLLNIKDLVDKSLSFTYVIDEEVDSADPILRLKKRLPDGQAYIFYEEILDIEAVKSDLNISLYLNGTKSNQAVNFGETLNYTLNYSNKGESSYKDAVMTAVFEGFMFDISSLESEISGDIRSNQIIWNQENIAGLKEIKPGDEGEISFSIKIKEFKEEYLLEDMEVITYSQYGGDNEEDTDNRSNVIVSAINSNLSIGEEIRYFDENNMPVGSGPLPPRVDETTTFRVYWRLQNNLHELRDTKVSLELPEYVSYEKSNSVSVGNMFFNDDQRMVIWDVGRLPASVFEAEASFTISITPKEDDRNKILVISTGAKAEAIDTSTKQEIKNKSGPKTTKLEDDEIAALNNTGRVE